MRTDLELALDCAVGIYHRFAARQPLDDYLSREEFCKLLKETAQPFLRDTTPPNTSTDTYINQLFAKADANRDGRLKFTEFLTTLCLVVINAHERSHEDPQGHDHDHHH